MKKIISFNIFLSLIFFNCKSNTNLSNKIAQSDTIIWVNSHRVPCHGVGNQYCLSIQKGEEIHKDKWELFYDAIEGFSYEEGFVYKLRVKIEQLDKNTVPADASTVNYTLLEIIEKNIDKTYQTINGVWFVKKLSSIDVAGANYRKKPQISFDLNELKASGNMGCNNILCNIVQQAELKSIRFSSLLSTKMLCENMELEDEFLKIHTSITNYSFENNQLLLKDDSGKVIVTLIR